MSTILLCFSNIVLKRFYVKRIFHYVKLYNVFKITIVIAMQFFPLICFRLNRNKSLE